MPDALSVRANVTEPGLTESLTFGYDNNPAIRTENASPYAIAGDSAGENYAPFDVGETREHTIFATPYSGDGATGSGGGGKRIVVTIFE